MLYTGIIVEFFFKYEARDHNMAQNSRFFKLYVSLSVYYKRAFLKHAQSYILKKRDIWACSYIWSRVAHMENNLMINPVFLWLLLSCKFSVILLKLLLKMLLKIAVCYQSSFWKKLPNTILFVSPCGVSMFYIGEVHPSLQGSRWQRRLFRTMDRGKINKLKTRLCYAPDAPDYYSKLTNNNQIV